MPPTTLITLNDIGTKTPATVPLYKIISDLRTRSAKLSRDPNNKYAVALQKIQAAKSVQDVNNALTGVEFKNGMIFGGRTKKIRKNKKSKKQKGGFKYSSNSKRRSLSSKRSATSKNLSA